MTPRGATDLCGILSIDKPAGMTSHDVVEEVRKATGERRIGHAGTLDPSATGVLVLLLGPMTRLARFLSESEKSYRATIIFGAETVTDDAEGTLTREHPVPDELAETATAVRAVAEMVGVHEQVPPDYSAVKTNGRKAYEVARGGATPELAPRTIEVRSATLLGVEAGPPLTWTVDVTVSKGTYVRSLARDLGRKLGTAAHVGVIARTASGSITMAESHTLQDIRDAASADTLEALFGDPVAALGLPVASLTREQAKHVAVGRSLPLDGVPDVATAADEAPVALVDGVRLVAVYVRRGALLVPDVVLAGA